MCVSVWLTTAMLLPLSSMESSFVTFFPSAVISLSTFHTSRKPTDHVSRPPDNPSSLQCVTYVCVYDCVMSASVCVVDGCADYSVTSSRTMLTKSSYPFSVPVSSLSPFISTQIGLPIHLSTSSRGSTADRLGRSSLLLLLLLWAEGWEGAGVDMAERVRGEGMGEGSVWGWRRLSFSTSSSRLSSAAAALLLLLLLLLLASD